MDFQTPLDIANRTCTLLGVRQIGAQGFAEDSVPAFELGVLYDKCRQIELRRNLWKYSIRNTVLYPCSDMTRLLQPAMWSSGTTYMYGSIVSDATNLLWISKIDTNLGQGPGYNVSAWELYTGPLAIGPIDTTRTYWAGEVVYIAPGDGTYTVYQSLTNNNSDVPGTVNAYDPAVMYHMNDVVSFNSVNYQSLVDLNMGNEPDTHGTQWTSVITAGAGSYNWRPVLAALARMNIIYPIGTGPLNDTFTRNYFHQPANYLRKAPQLPKAGSFSYLGSPSNLSYDDFEYDGLYIISTQPSIILRFGADNADVTQMDPEFCEGVALRMAVGSGRRITQEESVLNDVKQQFGKFMSEARLTNAIEQGAVEEPLDDWLACRV